MNIFSKLAKRLRAYSGKHGYTCDVCGAELFDYPAVRVCEQCETELRRNDGRTCPKCGRKTLAEGVCLSCKSRLPAFTKGFSPFVYRGTAAKLVNSLKNGNRRLAWYLGEEAAKYFLSRLSAEERGLEFLVLPVPLTAERERRRGYNQAEELAYSVLQTLKERGAAAVFDGNVIEKQRETPMQKNLSGRQRAENVTGAYHVHKRKFCQGKTILLIDDILTTGATGGECARILLSAGAERVYFLTVASTPEFG